MTKSSSRVLPRGWKSAVCGVAIATAALSGVPVGAAPPTVPGVPTGVVATAGVRSVKVAFTAGSDGGAKIANYHVTCTSSSTPAGKLGQHEGTKSPILVAGLTPGKTYTCTVAARNRVGLGANSDPSNAVVVLASAPGAPTITGATAGVRSVKLTFTPGSDGGAKITSYRAKCTSSDHGKPGARDGLKSPLVVGGLSAGKHYTCTVAARNRVGFGVASGLSTEVLTLSH